jgi:hypothetical protein
MKRGNAPWDSKGSLYCSQRNPPFLLVRLSRPGPLQPGDIGSDDSCSNSRRSLLLKAGGHGCKSIRRHVVGYDGRCSGAAAILFTSASHLKCARAKLTCPHIQCLIRNRAFKVSSSSGCPLLKSITESCAGIIRIDVSSPQHL